MRGAGRCRAGWAVAAARGPGGRGDPSFASPGSCLLPWARVRRPFARALSLASSRIRRPLRPPAAAGAGRTARAAPRAGRRPCCSRPAAATPPSPGVRAPRWLRRRRAAPGASRRPCETRPAGTLAASAPLLLREGSEPGQSPLCAGTWLRAGDVRVGAALPPRGRASRSGGPGSPRPRRPPRRAQVRAGRGSVGESAPSATGVWEVQPAEAAVP